MVGELVVGSGYMVGSGWVRGGVFGFVKFRNLLEIGEERSIGFYKMIYVSSGFRKISW